MKRRNIITSALAFIAGLFVRPAKAAPPAPQWAFDRPLTELRDFDSIHGIGLAFRKDPTREYSHENRVRLCFMARQGDSPATIARRLRALADALEHPEAFPDRVADGAGQHLMGREIW